jgi:hypothetical protein
MKYRRSSELRPSIEGRATPVMVRKANGEVVAVRGSLHRCMKWKTLAERSKHVIWLGARLQRLGDMLRRGELTVEAMRELTFACSLIDKYSYCAVGYSCKDGEDVAVVHRGIKGIEYNVRMRVSRAKSGKAVTLASRNAPNMIRAKVYRVASLRQYLPDAKLA